MEQPAATGPRTFVSYSHDSENHRSKVSELVRYLRENGVDARYDRFVENDPPLSWPKWMADEIREANYVLIIFTETYSRRFEGREEPAKGHGARWEGSIITSEMYYSNQSRVKFIPLVLRDNDVKFISNPLNSTNFYSVGIPQQTLIREKLLRHLYGEPEVPITELGKRPDFNTLSRSSEPENPAIRSAIGLASKGKLEAAENLLMPLLSSGSRVEAAWAAYYIGGIRLRSEQYSASITAFQRALELDEGSELTRLASLDLQTSLTILEAHYGNGSAVAAGRAYLKAVNEGDIEEVWICTEPTLRLVLTQAWVYANGQHSDLISLDQEKLAQDLASLTTPCSFQDEFFATQLREMQDAFQMYDDDQWGAAEKPRHFGLDYELVIYMETGGDSLIFQEGMSPPAIPLLMRRIASSWKVANFHAAYPIPGWPPTSEPLENLDLDIHRYPK